MQKKQLYIILATIIFFIIVIIITSKLANRRDWQKDILTATDYNITMENCNNRKIELPKDTVNTLFDKWEKLSDNGPWTGDEKTCYNKATITYDKDGIIQSLDILLIDNSSLVVSMNGTNRYYINSDDINRYLTSLFETY